MAGFRDKSISRGIRLLAATCVLAPALATLENLIDWTNRNSDGWAYWPKPCRSANKLITLIENAHPWQNPRHEPTAAEYSAALRPIKAFRTRQGADFDIVEVV